MNISLESKKYSEIETDALVSYVFEDSDPIQGHLKDIDQGANGLLRSLVTSGEVSGKMLEFTLIHAPAGLKATRFLLVGAGKRDHFNGATVRKIAGAALRYLKARSVKVCLSLARKRSE